MISALNLWCTAIGFLCTLLLLSVGCKEHPTGPAAVLADTTSNNFSFQTFSIGGHGGTSVLTDVWIASDTDIWAVGTIFLDSANGSPDPLLYNLAHWDGNKWNAERVPYNYLGQLFYHPILCIYAFSGTDIWLAGNGVQHWDGTRFNEIDLPISLWGQNRVNKIWGNSSSDLYIVGDSGSVARYDGQGWAKLPSGTTLRIQDIWGSANPSTILAVGNNIGENLLNCIIEINGNAANIVSSHPINYPLSTVWFVPNQHYYVGGSGLYEKNQLAESSWKNGVYDITQYYITSIRGNGTNDVFAVGSQFELLHYNGGGWHSFKDEFSLGYGAFGAVAVKGNLVVAVGLDSGKGVIVMGVRK